jgi:diaminopimelate decarboxylase
LVIQEFWSVKFYDARHNIIPVIKTRINNQDPVEFVGPICETSCKFIQYKKYQKIKEGDFVAITNVGAYGSSLSSNYNTKPLIAEILAKKNNFKIIRKKQDLLKLINS